MKTFLKCLALAIALVAAERTLPINAMMMWFAVYMQIKTMFIKATAPIS